MAMELKDRQGNIVTRNGATVFRADFTGAVKKGSVDLTKRTMWITGTTEAKDRDGDVIMVNGWDLKHFLKNPVFLWAHDYSSVPIGGIKRVVRRQEPKRMDFLVEFADMKDLWTFPELIMQMYADQKINTSSVGFIPRKHEPLEKDEGEDAQMFPGRRFMKQELLELSGCAVPSNPEALANSMKGYSRFENLDESRQKRILEYLIDGCHPEKMEEAKAMIEHNFAICEFVDEMAPVQVQVPKDLEEKDPPTEEGGEEITKEIDEDDEDVITLTLEDLKKNEDVVMDYIVRRYETDTIFVEKIGAVLNAKNKDLLKSASDNILKVLKSAETEDTTEVEDGKTPEHFEHLMVGDLPTTMKNPSTSPTVPAKSKGTTEEKEGVETSTITEADAQRLIDFMEGVRGEFPTLFSKEN